MQKNDVYSAHSSYADDTEDSNKQNLKANPPKQHKNDFDASFDVLDPYDNDGENLISINLGK